MGIPYYIASLLKTHKHLQREVGNAALEADVLGIDFNCFIHTYLKDDDPVGSIVRGVQELLTKTVKAKKILIAFDGLVPFAKIVQQRYRRFRKSEGTNVFDRHQISPGTPYMKELAAALRTQFPDIEISDTLERGEGEHKIFQWLRRLPENERHNICIYGLDADLALIAIAQRHLGHIQLLRDIDAKFYTFSIPALTSVLPLDPDEFVKICVYCFGNDFMPNIAAFSLREDGYERAIRSEGIIANEVEVLIKHTRHKCPRIVAPDGHELETRFGIQLMDGVLDWEPVVYAYRKTYVWTLHYFQTSEVLDWNWVYPYPEAPLLMTLNAYDFVDDFTWDSPEPTLTIEDQLRFILPSVNLRRTELEPLYEDELYDEEKETRYPWMRRFAWECDPYISLPRGTLTSVSEIHLPASVDQPVAMVLEV
jgi:5'-3' exonuclease